ncbi:hypothetical protein [Alkalihalobacillus sp. AL-G]|uniref:YphA family membrane protein n=1 Tax=Alkalihalobacillus sp. AL-G TaxID=2926399 RepID=UPI00272C4124|nr:hypothetical protein [Alkalihalobacillus sp. AL-G]WLD91841.1 hypothetical protein MOJ78_12410 [Alkalihalobacillus sp. AL-G]
MDGIYFYWFFWIAWIITTFFMPKTSHRYWLSFLLLLLIFSSTTTIHLDSYAVNAAFLFAGLISYAYIGKSTVRLIFYSVFSSMIVSVIYVGVHFLILFDPVWLFFDRLYLISFLLCALVLLLSKPLDLRLSILVSGLLNGEIGYALFVNGLAPGYIVGSFDLLDIVALSCMSVTVWWGYESLVSIVKQQVDKPISHLKGKAQ